MSSTRPEEAGPSRYVVLDTNIWRSELLLTSPMGEALIHGLVVASTRLGLPEIVERELTKHLVKAGMDASARITGGFDILSRILDLRDQPLSLQPGLVGFMPEPTPEGLQSAVQRRLDGLEPLLDRMPFRFEHAQGALNRIIAELPPNSEHNQQFKDSAIWEAILELADGCEVMFVTQDKGFYEGRDVGRGLASILRDECHALKRVVNVFSTIQACLRGLGVSESEVDEGAIAGRIDDLLFPILENSAWRKGFALEGLIRPQLARFPTGAPARVALQFKLTHPIAGAREDNDDHRGQLRVEGEAFLDLREAAISQLRLPDATFHWSDPTGEEFLAGDADVFTESTALTDEVIRLRRDPQ